MQNKKKDKITNKENISKAKCKMSNVNSNIIVMTLHVTRPKDKKITLNKKQDSTIMVLTSKICRGQLTIESIEKVI